MRDLSPDDRPREKLLRHGAAALGDNELVALVLGSGRPRVGALGVANELLRAQGGSPRTRAIDPGRSGAGGRRRRRQSRAADRRAGTGPADAGPRAERTCAAAHAARSGGILAAAFGSRPVEQFGVVLLDTKHRVLRTTVVAIGTLNTTVVQPRDVFREAVLGAAASVVVFHTHPSGDPSPSPDDVELTARLAAAGALMGIEMIDHIVLGDTRYCSFKEMGRL